MMLAIAIILGIKVILDLVLTKGDYDILTYIALILSVWESCFPLAVVLIVIGVILILSGN